MVEQKQRELVDSFTVDEVQNAPDEQFTGPITMALAIFSTVNK